MLAQLMAGPQPGAPSATGLNVPRPSTDGMGDLVSLQQSLQSPSAAPATSSGGGDSLQPLGAPSTDSVDIAEQNKGKRDHGLPKGITRRPNSTKLECKVHLDGKRFYVGLFETVDEALTAQVLRRREIMQAAKENPSSYKELSGRTTTGEEEIQKVRKAQAAGAPIEKVRGLRKRKNGRWETQIMHQGVRHYLGTFDTAEAALEARNTRARELSELDLGQGMTRKRQRKGRGGAGGSSVHQGGSAAQRHVPSMPTLQGDGLAHACEDALAPPIPAAHAQLASFSAAGHSPRIPAHVADLDLPMPPSIDGSSSLLGVDSLGSGGFRSIRRLSAGLPVSMPNTGAQLARTLSQPLQQHHQQQQQSEQEKQVFALMQQSIAMPSSLHIPLSLQQEPALRAAHMRGALDAAQMPLGQPGTAQPAMGSSFPGGLVPAMPRSSQHSGGSAGAHEQAMATTGHADLTALVPGLSGSHASASKQPYALTIEPPSPEDTAAQLHLAPAVAAAMPHAAAAPSQRGLRSDVLQPSSRRELPALQHMPASPRQPLPGLTPLQQLSPRDPPPRTWPSAARLPRRGSLSQAQAAVGVAAAGTVRTQQDEQDDEFEEQMRRLQEHHFQLQQEREEQQLQAQRARQAQHHSLEQACNLAGLPAQPGGEAAPPPPPLASVGSDSPWGSLLDNGSVGGTAGDTFAAPQVVSAPQNTFGGGDSKALAQAFSSEPFAAQATQDQQARAEQSGGEAASILGPR